MINILKGKWDQLEKINELVPNTWVNVVDPSAGEISHLQRELGIPHDFLVSALDIDEKARTEREENIRLILLRVPYDQGRSADVPFTTRPLGLILTDHLIVTVCQGNDAIMQDFISGHTARWSTDKRGRFLLQILLKTATKYLRYLRQINKETDALENTLQRSMKNEELLELLKYQKSLVYFTRALRSNELMLTRLKKSPSFDLAADDEDLLEDVLTEYQQAIEMVGISNDILSQMMDAFASIISNNLNVVMKFLTSVTIILMVPTLVASVYGMNVNLPFQTSPYAFLFTLIISFALSLMAVLVFLKKDWF